MALYSHSFIICSQANGFDRGKKFHNFIFIYIKILILKKIWFRQLICPCMIEIQSSMKIMVYQSMKRCSKMSYLSAQNQRPRETATAQVFQRFCFDIQVETFTGSIRLSNTLFHGGSEALRTSGVHYNSLYKKKRILM